jgi:peptide-methionine (R)-S-oxide reductase
LLPHLLLPLLLLAALSCRGTGEPRPLNLPGNGTASTDSEGTLTMTWNDVLRYAREGSPAPPRRVEKTDDEWRAVLTKEQYAITRTKGTERPFTGEYCESHEPGLYACIGCRTALFDSRRKFDSGTGWPSFSEPAAPNVIRYEGDFSYGMERIEVLCSVCDAHLGHVFPDGPGAGGLRYCINSASLIRLPDGAK